MLTYLQLRNFRCFAALAIELDNEFTFFIGGNGEGKTSILEAACVLLRLQSQRSASLAPLLRTGQKSFRLHGKFDGHALGFDHGLLHRRLTFDEVEQRRATEYLRLGRVVSLANADIELVRGSAEARRRYLDFLGAQIEPAYRPTLRAYERALRARNALLKSTPARPREIAAYNAPLIENGARLRVLRAEMIGQLAPIVGQAHHDISGRKERIDVRFASGVGEDFAADLAQSREKESRLRQTVVGPHRDDVELVIDGMAANAFASEGQQRSLALALKVAQARIFRKTGATPLLLIDDIFGELDPTRRDAFFSILPNESQKLVAATALHWRTNPPGRVYHLHDRELAIR